MYALLEPEKADSDNKGTIVEAMQLERSALRLSTGKAGPGQSGP